MIALSSRPFYFLFYLSQGKIKFSFLYFFSPRWLFQEDDEFKFTTNIMRWRHKRDNLGRLETDDGGRPTRETNSRLVKWSDGSMQLLVGDEAFDVGEHSIDRCVRVCVCVCLGLRCV